MVGTYGEVESYLRTLLLDISEETGFFIRTELVSEGRGRDNGDKVRQEPVYCQEQSHDVVIEGIER